MPKVPAHANSISLRRLAGYVNLELQTPKEQRFHRVYKGSHPARRDRVVLHLYDLSASDDKNAEVKANREADALGRLQLYAWAPRILDSWQDAPGYAGEMFFFTVVDPAAPCIEDRASDASWNSTNRLLFARDATRALNELHQEGATDEPVVHRKQLNSATFVANTSTKRKRVNNDRPDSLARASCLYSRQSSQGLTSRKFLPIPESTDPDRKGRPYFAFGLLTFFERDYASLPSPMWRSAVMASTDGEKHPADRTHTERLVRMQQVVEKCVARSLNAESDIPVLCTEISPEKADGLLELHRLCDWVVTLDRNAGIEYSIRPETNRDIYDAYVIDCVPEREDLGCLQLITSTSNLEEVRNLLDGALDQMGLSRSRRNAEFLLENLKELSGRLAIRLTGQKAPTAELIALAMCQANCRQSADDDECWTSLRNGFFVPVDDIRDLLPPVAEKPRNSSDAPDEDADGLADANADGAGKARRPDLIYVSFVPRKGIVFRFAEVKYRRHLRTARSPDALQSVRRQVESLRQRCEDWYVGDEVCASFRAVRRAKLARVLRFYLVLRLTESDAKVLARNVASSDQERTLIDRIKQMDRFRAYYCCEGQKKPVPLGLQP